MVSEDQEDKLFIVEVWDELGFALPELSFDKYYSAMFWTKYLKDNFPRVSIYDPDTDIKIDYINGE